jgi:hypothetical protein
MMQDARYLSRLEGNVVALPLCSNAGHLSDKRRVRLHVFVSFFAINLLAWVGTGYAVVHSLS